MSSNQVMVFAPGAWHQPSSFDKVRNALHSRGWATEAIRYPTVGAEPPTQHMGDDAAAIRATLERLADEGKDIVLVVHSYGGVAGAHAVEGLGRQQRAREGKAGGITMFLYLAAFVVPVDKSLKDMLGGQFLPWMKFDGDYSRPENPEEIFYHDLEPEDLKRSLADLQHESAAIFTDAVGYEPWHEITCGFIICDDDKALPPPVQEQMAAMLGPNSYVAHVKASHSPFLSKVEDTVDLLENAAKFGQDRISP